jgi:hypothetical protein
MDDTLTLLREHGWKYFVRLGDRKVFHLNESIQKLHPRTGAILGEYVIIGERNLMQFSDELLDFSRQEWKLMLCTGCCGRERGARCWQNSGPLDMCLARQLQLHPQAQVLHPNYAVYKEQL